MFSIRIFTIENLFSIEGLYEEANKIPVTSWIIKHIDNKEPMFHRVVKFIGAGNTVKVELTIFCRGSFLKLAVNIYFLRKGRFFLEVIFTATIKTTNKYVIKKIEISADKKL